jgi:hypothetical protein
MVSNATFNNISVISWRSVLLGEVTGVTRGWVYFTQILSRSSRGRDRIVVRFTSTHPISAYHNVSISNPVHDEMYSIQLYVIKFGFLSWLHTFSFLIYTISRVYKEGESMNSKWSNAGL